LGKKKRRGWGLKQLSLEFNLLVTKVGAVFEKKEVPKKSTRLQRTRIKREVRTELVRIAEKEKQPTNIVASAITQIADKERKRAIRNGDYADAVFAAIVQYYIDQAAKNPPNTKVNWVNLISLAKPSHPS
jgi:hypothetical protein